MQRVLAPVTWDDIEDALNDLEGLEDGISDEEREKQLSAITTEVENIKSKLAKLNKPEFFQMHNGQIDCDIREIFFKWWLYVQNLCNQPCNPRGFNLDSSLPLEIEAYHKLGIGRAVNKKRPEGPAEG
ncbi:hypothetical protein [uncultured Desulfosarcina sp.]|uniref:hypothetical protein n=1 Tax=uncultured Desulfosarcina sp. TaxID=218289 RepID=UPI0029C83BBA|nr:hypothetical protein [uncultured Desulfosarcina sp.]